MESFLAVSTETFFPVTSETSLAVFAEAFFPVAESTFALTAFFFIPSAAAFGTSVPVVGSLFCCHAWASERFLVFSFPFRFEFGIAVFTAEILEFTVEKLVFAELAFQGTVEQRYLYRGFQANLVETFVAVAQNPGVIPCKGMFQAFTDHLIQPQQVFRRDTFAVRRVHDDDTLFRRLFKLLERLDGQYDILADARCLHVVGRSLSDCCRIRISCG